MELYFNMYKIKYVILDELLKDINFNNGEEINIFINLESLLKQIKGTKEDRENILSGPRRNLFLISCIFNLIAHYRRYFNKRHIYSNIFIYGPEGIEKSYLNKEYIIDYRKNINLLETTDTKSIGNMYKNSIIMLKEILSYVQNVYFITSGIIEPSVIPYIITEDLNIKRDKTFLVTKDIYEYQYIKEDFYILRPKMDNSKLINNTNIMTEMKNKTKCKNTVEPDNNFIPFILSILGDSYRGIPKINKIGIATIFKMIEKGIKDNVINNDVENIMSLINIVDENNKNQVMLNYLCTNIKEQDKRLSNSEISYIKRQLIDKYDAGYLKELNDKFFIEYPLNIEDISHEISKKKKIIWG